MPQIPIQTPLEYTGVLLLIAGIFLLLAGAKIIRVQKITIQPGKKTLVTGFILTAFGVLFLLPNTIRSIVETATPTLATNITNTPFSSTPAFASTPTQIGKPLSPSPTPTDKENLLFFDTFDSNINGWVTGYREGSYSKQTRTIANGVFEFSVLFTIDNGFTWANAQNFRVKNFNMSVEAEIVQSSVNSTTDVVIAFRYGNLGKTTYVVTFGNDSSFSFYSSIDDQWNLIYSGKSDAFQVKDGVKNTFGVRGIEQKFTIYANGQELHTLEDSSFNYAGEIGIGVKGNREKSVLVRFDNFAVAEAP